MIASARLRPPGPNAALVRPDVDGALAIIAAATNPLGTEEIDVRLANGRVTARPVFAAQDAPRFDAAAMDGFALRIGPATAYPAKVRVAGRIAAGQWPMPLEPWTAMRISTGAPVPDDTTAILIQEAAAPFLLDGVEYLHLAGPVEPDRNIRRRGEDRQRGESVLDLPVALTPDAIGALVSYGIDRVLVRCIPRMALLSTGTELADLGMRTLARPQVFDCNAPMIAAAARQAGLAVEFLGGAVDDEAVLETAIDRAISSPADLIVSTGGVSSGDHDHVRRVLARRGATILLHGVRMRPGKPMLVARLADGRLYFGLPGNPVAAFVAFRFFVLHAARALLALPAEAGDPVCASPHGRPDTTIFLRGRRRTGPDGSALVDTSLDQRSHVLRSLLQADTWVRVDDREGRLTARAYPKNATFLT